MSQSNWGWENSDMEDDMDEDVPTVTIADDAGRTLTCTIEHSLQVEDQEYVLLLPVDAPVEIFSWQDEDDEEDPLPVEEDGEIDRIFPTAKVVLEEQNLVLKRTAVTLTVEGDLPDLDEEDDFLEDEAEEGDEYEEELQLLARFYHEEQEYAVYTPLDPFFIFARLDEEGNPQLLSPEEFKKIEPMLPMLEDQLFDALE